MKNLVFKTIAFLLLFLFAADSLAILDLIESPESGSHFAVTEISCAGQIHVHPSSDASNNPAMPDPCFLCACCVSGVDVQTSNFEFDEELRLLGIVTFRNSAMHEFSSNSIFHPPRYFSHVS